jgi:hypothetical protein
LYNQGLIGKAEGDLLTSFVSLAQKLNDKNVEELWRMLFFMCEMPKGLLVGESRDQSTKVQIHFVNRAVSYLEQCFKDLLQSTVNANLKQAKIGGAPGTLALVTGYLR